MFRSPIAPTLVLASLALIAVEPAAADHFAILAAAPKCKDARWPTLRFAEQDMARLGELLAQSGYAAENIVRLSPSLAKNDKALAATRENLLAQIAAIGRRTTPDDTLLIALSGHGAEIREGDLTEPSFCPTDGSPASPPSLLSLAQIVAAVEDSCPAKKIVLIVDSCRTRRKNGAEELATRGVLPKLPPRWFAYWSCAAGESAYEDPRVQHGVFPHFVIEGLRGSADASEDGRVTTAELEEFVTPKTTDHVKTRLGKSQTPQSTGIGDDPAVIAVLAPTP